MPKFDPDYLSEKLFLAVDCLAASTLPLGERMLNAAMSALHTVMFDEEPSTDDADLVDLWARTNDIIRRLTERGTFEATITALNDDELKDIASKLVWALSDSVRLSKRIS